MEYLVKNGEYIFKDCPRDIQLENMDARNKKPRWTEQEVEEILKLRGYWIHEEIQSNQSITGYFKLPSCECSNCGFLVQQELNFCPNCGCLMTSVYESNIKIQFVHQEEKAEMGNVDLPKTEILAQLGEEAAELAQAALKLRRKLDGTNPTPVSEAEAWEAIIEELSDVALCCDLLNIRPNYYTMQNKLRRWGKRLEGKQ